MSHPILIVQGGQWGSEAKGAIAAYLTQSRRIDIAVRTGATNAGHTVYYRGVPVKMQQLPVGWVNPYTTLVVGAGALIDPDILEREVALVSDLTKQDIRQWLRIDRRAGLHVPAHAARSKASGRHHTMGATGKGCSEALMDRIANRGSEDPMLFGTSPYAKGYDVCDTEAYLNYSYDEGAKILLEGTQGQLLDLYLGPYPYTTHKQTGPAQWMLEAGLSPSLPTEIVMVVRTFPIRVAGNSGPMPSEISWPELAREINFFRIGKGQPPIVADEAIRIWETTVKAVSTKYDIPDESNGTDQHRWNNEERKTFARALSEIHKDAWNSLPMWLQTELSALFELTTVTRKLRRVARLDRESLIVSARQMRPSWVAVTFMNYLFPEWWYRVPTSSTAEMVNLMVDIEDACRAPVRMMSFGPEDSHILEIND